MTGPRRQDMVDKCIAELDKIRKENISKFNKEGITSEFLKR